MKRVKKYKRDPDEEEAPVDQFENEEKFELSEKELSVEARRCFGFGTLEVKTPLGHKSLISARELETSKRAKGRSLWHF
jgi:hypothetical protein